MWIQERDNFWRLDFEDFGGMVIEHNEPHGFRALPYMTGTKSTDFSRVEVFNTLEKAKDYIKQFNSARQRVRYRAR